MSKTTKIGKKTGIMQPHKPAIKLHLCVYHVWNCKQYGSLGSTLVQNVCGSVDLSVDVTITVITSWLLTALTAGWAHSAITLSAFNTTTSPCQPLLILHYHQAFIRAGPHVAPSAGTCTCPVAQRDIFWIAALLAMTSEFEFSLIWFYALWTLHSRHTVRNTIIQVKY